MVYNRELIDNGIKVELSYRGEGLYGDYNESNHEDQQLLRFYVYFKDFAGKWKAVDDASYCTKMPVTITEEQADKALRIIANEYERVYCRIYCGESVKKLGERLSLMDGDNT